MKIKVKVLTGDYMPQIIDKGDWVDLKAADTMHIKAPQAGVQYQSEGNKFRDVETEVVYIPLGIAMQLPKGFEAIVAPRSSTPKKLGIMCANSFGVIDNSYCGDNDEWKFPAIALRPTTIVAGSRICQFRIQLSQKATFWQKLKWLLSSKIEFVRVYNLGNKNRKGFGSTGVN